MSSLNNRTFGLSILLLASTCLTHPAFAQSNPPPPVRQTVDENSVEVVSGKILISSDDVVIGRPGQGGLTYSRFSQGSALWRDSMVGSIEQAGSLYTISLGGLSDSFTLADGVYTSTEGRGATLTVDSIGNYTYVGSDGMIAEFVPPGEFGSPGNKGRIISIKHPSGELITFYYKSAQICNPPECETFSTANRVSGVGSNLGYLLKPEYAFNGPGLQLSQLAGWLRIVKVTGINTAVEYCDPLANSCALTNNWPKADYAEGTIPGGGSFQTVTDSLDQSTRYTFANNNALTGVRRPSSATDNVTIAYDVEGRVATLIRDGQTWGYTYLDVGTVRTTTITDPMSHKRVVKADLTTGRVTSDKDPLSRTTTYTYDAKGRLARVTQPEGNYAEVVYDARGNVVTTTTVAKAGSGLANIVTTSSYDATCVNPVKCNQPNSTVDPRGNQTDYTYDTTHGGLLTITLPAPAAGTIRPKTTYGYTQLNAFVKNSSGGFVASGPVQRITSISTCASGSSCVGSVNEVKTTTTYGQINTANNLLPTSVSSGAGDGSLTATTAIAYTIASDPAAVDGPLPGPGDTDTYRYDRDRQLVGGVGPDPDETGALKRRAVRFTYNADGQPTMTERGTVNGLTDPDWGAFASLEQRVTTYDTAGRATKIRLDAGGATQEIVQYSYDGESRLDCLAVRMNAAVFGSLPASACILGTAGSDGPDRITKATWDAADEVIKLTTGHGTTAARDEVVVTYTNNGKQETLADGEGRLTTYEYEGHDRLKKVRFPNPAGGGSSTSDYFEYGYDASSNLTSDRRRSGQVIAFDYDNLDRNTLKDWPGTAGDVTYAYDNLGRITTMGQASQTLSFTYDALGRNLSQGGPLAIVSYQYDVAGRRTRLTWPDGLFIAYDYDLTDAMTAIRENGATAGAGLLATFAYDNLGRRAVLTRGNGAVTTYGYDPASRLTSLINDVSSTANDLALTFTHNPSGQIKTRTASNDAYAWPDHFNVDRGYIANGLNQLVSAGGVTLTYDTKGNLNNDGTHNFGYDLENRLTSETVGGATIVYDPVGRLYETGPATVRFGYDGLNLIAEYDGGGILQRRYVHGPAPDEPLAWYEGSNTALRRWFIGDERGSVVAITNANGVATKLYAYDEYGLTTAGAHRFLYTGQVWLPEAGVYHYKARAYSPELGRFLQPDPIGYDGGMNLYAYVNNDPVNLIDPLGNTCQSWISAIVVGYWAQISTRCWSTAALTFGSERSVPRGNERAGGGGRGPTITHRYNIRVSTVCSPDETFNALKAAGMSAPGAPPAREGTRSNIQLFGIGKTNPITQTVNSRTRTIVNVTQVGHDFHWGSVVIRVIPQPRNNSDISIVGTGGGPHPLLNELIGGVIFGHVASTIQQACSVNSGWAPMGY